jgi:hypothetical protein
MHASPTARTEDFRQYGSIHTDMGHWGWTRIRMNARGRGRPRALAATVQSRMARANVAREMERAMIP